MMEKYKNRLLETLKDILLEHPGGIKEYELLVELRQLGLPLFAQRASTDALALFEAHFLLFHLLYCLRDDLIAKKAGDLEIHCLKIALLPWREPQESNLPGPVDPLKRYYLDLTHLEEMTLEEAEGLIDRFWEDYYRYLTKPESLAILGLSPGASKQDIKERYRLLAKEHHPDHGGNAEDFQRLQLAAENLLT